MYFWYNMTMFYTKNAEELMAIGYQLGLALGAGDVVILSGDLGAGKTTFTKGLAKGLGIEQMVKSPTYTIVRSYEGRLPLYHLDVYRIGNDPDSIDLDDFLSGDGVTVIEWGDLLDSRLFTDYLAIRISLQDDGRCLHVVPHGERSKRLAEECFHG